MVNLNIEDTWNLLAYVPFGAAAIKGIKGLLGANKAAKSPNNVLKNSEKTRNV